MGGAWVASNERAAVIRQFDGGDAVQPVCDRCQELDLSQWLAQKPPYRSLRQLDRLISDDRIFRLLGTADTLMLDQECPVCRCLFGLLPTPDHGGQDIYLVLMWTLHRLDVNLVIDMPEKENTSRFVTAVVGPPWGGGSLSITCTYGDAVALGAEDSPGDTQLTALDVDPHSLNINRVAAWIKDCERLHPATCLPAKSEDLAGILVIDALNRRIVPHQPTYEYLTLSYVWGGSQPSAFKAEDRDKPLGRQLKTIEDAMTLVQRLGKRYLWVDAVCINQTNPEEKKVQISKMCSIYQGAYATIVAVEGENADSGLPRLGQRDLQVYPQLRCTLPDGRRLRGLGPTLAFVIAVRQWGRRGWTLQEGLLPARCIFLSSIGVYFECNAMQCMESVDERACAWHQIFRDESTLQGEDLGSRYGQGLLRSFVPYSRHEHSRRLETFRRQAELYSCRQLTYQTDALNAFDGVMKALQTCFYHKGFIFGCPLEDLNWALLWEQEDSKPSTGVRDFIPSWSWLHPDQIVSIPMPVEIAGSPPSVRPIPRERIHTQLTISAYVSQQLQTVYAQSDGSEQDISRGRPPAQTPRLLQIAVGLQMMFHEKRNRDAAAPLYRILRLEGIVIDMTLSGRGEMQLTEIDRRYKLHMAMEDPRDNFDLYCTSEALLKTLMTDSAAQVMILTWVDHDTYVHCYLLVGFPLPDFCRRVGVASMHVKHRDAFQQFSPRMGTMYIN